MKKIGILHGKERSFPDAFVERINSKKIPGIMAEPVKIDKVMQGEATEYAVIVDRISQDVPFYRAYLKKELKQWKKNPKSEANPKGYWLHPEDVGINMQTIAALDLIISHFPVTPDEIK